MNTEQERAAFEAWCAKQSPVLLTHVWIDNPDRYFSDYTQAAWEAWQARAALQSQDREDAERIQFMADEACTFNTWKQEDGSWKYRLEWDYGTEWQTQWFDSPEEAIDHARRIQGEGE